MGIFLNNQLKEDDELSSRELASLLNKEYSLVISLSAIRAHLRKHHFNPKTFLTKTFPDGNRFMQDNDPKHTSQKAKQFYLDDYVNWWKTPASSADLN